MLEPHHLHLPPPPGVVVTPVIGRPDKIRPLGGTPLRVIDKPTNWFPNRRRKLVTPNGLLHQQGHREGLNTPSTARTARR